MNEQIIFINNNIDKKRYDDVRFYFKGKELEFNEENLVNELITHPEWKQEIQTQPTITIQILTPKNKIDEKI